MQSRLLKASALIAILLSSLSLSAEPTTPSAQEFKQLLTGNSLVGKWEGRHYHQYFNADGTTIYKARNEEPSTGKWRIKSGGQFCSTWPGVPTDVETCYKATTEKRKIYWPNKQGELFASTVVPGNILLQGDEQPVVDMSRQEFTDFISGNSLLGIWGSAKYKQHFTPQGQTSYQEARNRPSDGTWRINEAGQYCSVWPPSPTEVCYKAQRQGAKLLWYTSEGKVFPADLFEGNILLERHIK